MAFQINLTQKVFQFCFEYEINLDDYAGMDDERLRPTIDWNKKNSRALGPRDIGKSDYKVAKVCFFFLIAPCTLKITVLKRPQIRLPPPPKKKKTNCHFFLEGG